MTKTSRHPAVLDLSGGSTPPRGPQNTPRAPRPPKPRGEGRKPGKRTFIALGAVAVAVAGTGIVAALGGGEGDPAPATETAATEALGPTDENGLPILKLPDVEPSETPTTAPAEETCRSDRGDQKSGADVIAAFNYAYYVERNAAAARALATPSSTVQPVPDLQKTIDQVPAGTAHCVKSIALSEGVYLVDLSLNAPDQPAKRGTLTVTTQKIDNRWYVDAFKD
ncbi:hypothetical protein HG717_01355 [Rhodococcus erythropolis]|uniref:hypothetical protein n=1 Tax=Rhodococcus TaxID=1827 RepID=UPI001AE19D82|nr:MULTISPECIES: hypothetical protein [Rhodococcus]MBP2520964.1 hypothetical protein [Rhodococcus sp. PvP104]MBY6382559.1 hypothetical protein [Rhodococcus erythropolis]